MKINFELYLLVIIAFVTSCSSDKKVNDGLVHIDVRKIYPEKEIILTDIADINYVYLSSDDDDYLYRGRINCITKNTIVIHSYPLGDILFFSKDGNPKSRFNRKGNGPEEYKGAGTIIYDETADDLFFCQMNDILVYSSMGEYKRKLTLPKATTWTRIISFDDHSLLLYDAMAQMTDRKRLEPDDPDFPTNNYVSPFVRISKADGKVLEYVEIPNTSIVLGAFREDVGLVPGRANRLVKIKEGVLLCNPETDTVFLYCNDKPITPLIYKTPSVDSLDPMVYLNNCVDVGRFQFIEIFTVRFEEGAFPFPAKYLMRDKKTGEIFRQKIILPDYKEKEFIISPVQSGDDYENGPYFELDLIELKQAYRENKLSGELKELVAKLNEDEDNNVFMLIHFK